MTILSELRKKHPEYDDITDQQLADAYHKKYYPNAPKDKYYNAIGFNSESYKPEQGLKGIAHEAYQSIIEPLSHPISSLLNALPGAASETLGLAQQGLSVPFEGLQGKVPRLTKNIVQGFENFVNAPSTIAGYLGKHGILFPEDTAEKAHIKVNPFELGEQEPGDIFAQGIPSAALLGPLGEAGQLSKLARTGARAGSGAAFGVTQNQNPLHTAILNSLAIPGAQNALSKGKNALSNAYSRIPSEIGEEINAKRGQINELEPALNIPEEQTHNLLNYPTGEELVPNALKAKQEELLHKKHYLTSNQPKGVEFAEKFYNSVSHAKKAIQKQNYDPVETYTKDSHIRFPRTADVQAIEKQLESFYGDKLTKGEPAFEKARQEFINKHVTHDLVPAYDYIQNWKSTKQAAAKARRLGFKEGGENKDHWQSEAAKLQQIADKQLEVLKNHLPEQYFNKLKQGDKLWKENIIPFYGNKIYEQSKPGPNRGKIDVKDIMHEVRANEPGQSKARELILSNPDLSRLALGHKYAENPEGLLTAGPYEQQFISKLPSLQGMIERSRQHNLNLKIAEVQHKALQEARKRTELGHKESVAKQNERQRAITEKEKLNEEIEKLLAKGKKLNKQKVKGTIKNILAVIGANRISKYL